MRGALNSMRLRAVRAAVNQWDEQAAAAKVRHQRLRVFHPDTRLRRAAFNSMRAGFEVRRALRKAVGGIRMNRENRALRAWADGVDSFHIGGALLFPLLPSSARGRIQK